MILAEKLDLVDICTPPQTHARLAVEAMKQGCHVLIEKPMALTVLDCDEIVKASKENGVKVCVAHSDLFYPPFMDAKEVVEKGGIGDFRGMRIFLSTPTNYMTSNENHWAHKLPGGVIGETGPHIVYMTLAFINPIRDVSVEALKILDYPWSKYEDYRINFIGEKAISSVYLTYASDQWVARTEIIGSKNILTLDLEGMYLAYNHRPTLGVIPVGSSVLREAFQEIGGLFSSGIKVLTGKYRNTHDIIIERFIMSIINGTPSPVTAEEGREAVRVLNMIVEKLDKKVN